LIHKEQWSATSFYPNPSQSSLSLRRQVSVYTGFFFMCRGL